MVLNLLRHFLTQVDISYWQRIRSRECQDDGLNYREEFTQFLIWIYVYSFIVRFTEFLAMLIPCVRDIFWCWMMKLFGTGQKIVPPSWTTKKCIWFIEVRQATFQIWLTFISMRTGNHSLYLKIIGELWIFSELLTVELDEDNGTMF